MVKIILPQIAGIETSNLSILECIIYKDGDRYCGLCLDLDVPSEGDTSEEAKNNLIETIKDYIEVALKNKSKLFNPVPLDESPLINNAESIVERFKVEVNLNLLEIEESIYV